MIIAAYTACGKSYWPKVIPDSIDLTVMPYKWILPDTDERNTESEKEKGAMYHVFHPFWTINYIQAVLQAEQKYAYVIIPSIESVITDLAEKYHREVCLVYPRLELREEYRQRFLERGNSESFLEIFYDGWDERIRSLMELNVPKIELNAGEYLTDVKDKVDRMTHGIRPEDDAEYLRALQEVGHELEERRKEMTLCVCGRRQVYYLELSEITSNETRTFIYRIARAQYEKDMIMPRVYDFKKEKFREFEMHVSTKEELLERLVEEGILDE